MSNPTPSSRGRQPMGSAALFIWALLAAIAFIGFVSLGTWQVERRAWKQELVQRIDARVHAPAVAPPPRADWDTVSADGDEYRRVTLDGTYLHDRSALVQASTILGSGFWVMTPLRADDGTIVLVNRGFVPQTQRTGAWRDALPATQRASVTGLLRLDEPESGFLRQNDPSGDRWFSRNVRQLAGSRDLMPGDTAPYFIDAEAAGPLPPELTLHPPERLPDDMLPVGGLTVIRFANNHLTYLLTWYGLALMVAAAAWYVGREELRLRRERKRLTLRSHEDCDDATPR